MSEKYSTFSAANHPNPIQRRLTEIGYHCQARVKPPMQCQCTNSGPIRCQSRAHFGLATSRQSMAHWGQSCAITIWCQSNVDQATIYRRSSANPFQSGANPRSTQCQSNADPMSIKSQSSANLLPIRCQSGAADPVLTRSRSVAYPMSIESQSIPIQCQSDLVPIQCEFSGYLMPILRKS